MKIVEPSVELWEQKNPVEHVCRCAQVSYQSEPKTGEAAEKFYNTLEKSGHLSCFRHESCYYIIPKNLKFDWLQEDITHLIYDGWQNCPYIELHQDAEYIYASTNAQFIREFEFWYTDMSDYRVGPTEFKEVCPDLMRYSFCLTTQISTTRELLRHSPQNCTELSTRYIKFGGKVEPSIVRPYWMSSEENLPDKWWETTKGRYTQSCNDSFCEYEKLLELGLKPQDARGVLPLDTMSKIVMTHSIKEWRKIIDMRYYGTTGAPHGNIKLITGLVRDELIKLGYTFR